MYTHAHIHMDMHGLMHTYIHTCMHACFHMHTCTHTHTHKFTGRVTAIYSPPLNLSTDELLHGVSAEAWRGILQSLTNLWCPLNEAE